jgi:hypothetical protein
MHIEYWKKNISILAKATQVSDVAHGPLVFFFTNPCKIETFFYHVEYNLFSQLLTAIVLSILMLP